ncbi:MAG TPA: hypothetical protein VMF90_07880 [Rhizobiaceae bacterium]|nr:hypothetical protein [Rhizobiaceae bacterium]
MAETIPPSIEDLRKALRSGRPFEKLDAIEAASKFKQAAAPLIPDLVALLSSDEYVQCTSLDIEAFGHAVIAERACAALGSIGIMPDIEVLRSVLNDKRVHELPEASYDQGAYIGDYGTEYVAPAAIAAKLIEYLGPSGFDLLPEIIENAMVENEHIGKPSRRVIAMLGHELGTYSPDEVAAYAAAIETIGSQPEALKPTTHRGFDLRDLAIFGRRKLAAFRAG